MTKSSKISGFTLLEVLAVLTITTTLSVMALTDTVNENKKEERIEFIKNTYSVIKAVDHRIAIDGYDPTLWTQTEWIDKNEIMNNLIQKELNSTSSNCPNGAWNPTIASEQNTKLLNCESLNSSVLKNKSLSAKFNTDSMGFIESFDLIMEFDNNTLEEEYLDYKVALRKVKVNESQEISGIHSIDFISKTSNLNINSATCISNFNDCSLKFSYNRSGGNEYIRADGENSMINANLSFIEAKNQAPLKCVRWVNTNREGTGVWSREIDENCGIGIHTITGGPVMVDTVADTGTFKNVVLDRICSVYAWNGNDVVDSGTFAPCGMTNDGTEVYQVVNNSIANTITANTANIGNINFNAIEGTTARIEDLTVSLAKIDTILTDRIETKTLDVVNSLKVQGNSKFEGTVDFESTVTFDKEVTFDDTVFFEDNISVDGNITASSGNISSSSMNASNAGFSNLTVNNQFILGMTNSEGAGCSTNGMISKTSTGEVLSCVSGTWALAGGGLSTRIATNASKRSSASVSCGSDTLLSGGASCREPCTGWFGCGFWGSGGDPGELYRSMPDGNSWSASCKYSGDDVTVYAVCAR